MQRPQHAIADRLTPGNTKWFTLATCCLIVFMVMLDNLVVNVAMPTISRDFEASTVALQWIVSAYTLVFASLQITAGGLGDRYGRKRFFLVGIVAFGLTSLLAAFSQSIEMLILARALQGLAAAILLPLSLSLVSAAFTPAERPKALGYWTAVSVSGLAFGPIIGGAVVQYFTWHWVFLINIPIVVIAYVLALGTIQESRDTAAPPKLDLAGTVLVTLAIASLTWGLIDAGEQGWGSTFVVIRLVAAAVLLAAFIRVEARAEAPMVPLTFFRSSTFTGANIDSFFISFMIASIAFSMTLYFQNVHGMTPLQTGMTLLPMVIVQMLVTPVIGSLVNRVGPRRLITLGMLIVAGSALLFLRTSATGTFIDLIPAQAVLGLGMAIASIPMTTSVLNSVPSERAGVASAVNGATRELGFAFGIALLGSIMNQTYQTQFNANTSIVQLRATPEIATGPLGDLIDFVGGGMNFAGWVIEDPRLWANAPAGALEQMQASGLLSIIRTASSEAFVAGMHTAFIIASGVLAAAAILSWFLIKDRAVIGQPAVAADMSGGTLSYDPAD